MKLRMILGLASALAVGALPLAAQEANEVEQLKKGLQEMREKMRLMEQALEKLQQKQKSSAAEQEEIKKTVEAKPAQPAPTPSTNLLGAPWTPAQPIRLFGTDRAFMNLSLDGLFTAGGSTANDIESLQPGGHDPKQRGFTVQNLETTFEGKVDPYFRGQAAIIYQIDPEGESFLELEEAYAETLALPWGLQARAGQFFTEFGRLNQLHPHAWDFVDQPLVNGRFLGADGLRSAGGRLSWLMPTPFYSEAMLTLQNSQGETAFSFRDGHEEEVYLGRLHQQGGVKNLNDLLFVPRYVTSFNLSDSQTVMLGASAAFGPNGSGNNTDSQVFGLDAFWKWKSTKHNAGFPFVSWQTEAMLRRYQAGAFDWDLDGDGVLNPDGSERDLDGDGVPDVLPRETLKDWGIYSQALWGFRKGWVAGLRGDYVGRLDNADYEGLFGNDADRNARWRFSPNLTWYPTEFSKLRLQYNYDNRKGIGEDHSIWLQLEFLLGAHSAHKF